MPMRRSRIRSRSGACRAIAITEIEHPVFAIKITVGDFPAILIDKREISANLRSRQRRFVTRRLISLRPTGNQREKCEKSERKKGFVPGNASHALLKTEIKSIPDR